MVMLLIGLCLSTCQRYLAYCLLLYVMDQTEIMIFKLKKLLCRNFYVFSLKMTQTEYQNSSQLVLWRMSYQLVVVALYSAVCTVDSSVENPIPNLRRNRVPNSHWPVVQSMCCGSCTNSACCAF